MPEREELLKAIGIGAAAGTLTGLAAFFLLTWNHYPFMGITLFILMPVVAGFSLGWITRKGSGAIAAGVLSILGSLVILIALGKEGPLCAVMALPLLAAGLFMGLVLSWLVRRLFALHRGGTTTGILLIAAPLVIVAGDRIEAPTLRYPRTEIVETAIQINAPAERVWRSILSIDSVQGSKPILMYIGLPIPQRCTLQGQGVGAKRTCYFNAGYIQETVVAWNPPYYLGLTIDRTHMPGRHWLGFEGAEYRLASRGPATMLTRRTTFFSHLRPAWYWRPLERIGVESEHNYILQDLVAEAQR